VGGTGGELGCVGAALPATAAWSGKSALEGTERVLPGSRPGCSDSTTRKYQSGDAGEVRSSEALGATVQRGRAAPRQLRANEQMLLLLLLFISSKLSRCARRALRCIAGYRIHPVRLGHAQLRQYCFYASFETRNQIRTPQTELNGVVLCPKLCSLVLGYRILVVLGGIWGQNKAKVSVFNGSVR
jgi:hypothetical protein